MYIRLQVFAEYIYVYNYFPTVFSVFLLVYFNMVCVYVCTI